MSARKSTLKINFGNFRMSDESRFLAQFPIVATMPELGSRNFDYAPIAASAIAALNAAGIHFYSDVWRAPQAAMGNDEFCPGRCLEHIRGVGLKTITALLDNLMGFGWDYQDSIKPVRAAACSAADFNDVVSEEIDDIDDIEPVTIGELRDAWKRGYDAAIAAERCSNEPRGTFLSACISDNTTDELAFDTIDQDVVDQINDGSQTDIHTWNTENVDEEAGDEPMTAQSWAYDIGYAYAVIGGVHVDLDQGTDSASNVYDDDVLAEPVEPEEKEFIFYFDIVGEETDDIEGCIAAVKIQGVTPHQFLGTVEVYDAAGNTVFTHDYEWAPGGTSELEPFDEDSARTEARAALEHMKEWSNGEKSVVLIDHGTGYVWHVAAPGTAPVDAAKEFDERTATERRDYTVGAIKDGESGYDVHLVPVAVADHLAGMSPYQGALAALFERTMQIGYTELDEDKDEDTYEGRCDSLAGADLDRDYD